jgi:hypothetical protein
MAEERERILMAGLPARRLAGLSVSKPGKLIVRNAY